MYVQEKTLAAEKILEDVRGRMMKDIVLLDRSRTLPNGKRAFRLRLSRREIDMVIYDRQANVCEEFEIKNSRKAVPEQTRAQDVELNAEVEAKYGKAVRRSVIYRGESRMDGEIEYLNVEEYLKSL